MSILYLLYAVSCGLNIMWALCFLVVLVKVFRSEGVVAGIFGLLCGLYTFIWGWIHRKEQGIEGVMLLWLALFLLGAASQIVAVMYGY